MFKTGDIVRIIHGMGKGMTGTIVEEGGLYKGDPTSFVMCSGVEFHKYNNHLEHVPNSDLERQIMGYIKGELHV